MSPNILDVIAEDLLENVVRFWDFVLAKLCQNLQCFSPDKLLEVFSHEMVTEPQQKLKKKKNLQGVCMKCFSFEVILKNPGLSD